MQSSSQASSSFLVKLFPLLSRKNVDLHTEVLAGLTTFITMAYIIAVNPNVLGSTGMDKGALVTATCLAAAIGCFVMGFVADLPLFLAMFLACILIQIATNLFNEYYDFKTGLDDQNSVGISGVIVRGETTPDFILQLAIGLYVIAGGLGAFIAFKSSWIILGIGAYFMLLGYLYCAGPLPLSTTPFGEVVAGLVMGEGITLISFYIQTHTINWQIILLALPSSLLIAQILTANNLRDMQNDREKGRRTLVIHLGKRRSIIYMTVIFFICYLLLPILIVTLNLSVFILLALISAYFSVIALRTFFNNSVRTPEKLMPAMLMTARTSVVYHIFLILGLCITLITKG